MFCPIFYFSIAYPVPTMELQGTSARQRGQVPSQTNKPDWGARGQGIQSAGGMDPKGELKLHIQEIISREIQLFRELRNK